MNSAQNKAAENSRCFAYGNLEVCILRKNCNFAASLEGDAEIVLQPSTGQVMFIYYYELDNPNTFRADGGCLHFLPRQNQAGHIPAHIPHHHPYPIHYRPEGVGMII